MKLGKLKGYDESISQYINDKGEASLLPKSPYCVANALPSDYDDISDSIESWVNYSIQFIDGTITGFKDILCMRAIIKPLIYDICGSDFSNFDALTPTQKIIACTYFPTKIIDARGGLFFATEVGGFVALNSYIAEYNRMSEPARKQRYSAVANCVYLHLGKTDGLKAESLCPIELIHVGYQSRGVVFRAEDGIDGFGDWLQSTDSFSETGLKARIDSGEFTIKTGMPTQSLIDSCIAILDEGLY